jgi:hypothetical protein
MALTVTDNPGNIATKGGSVFKGTERLSTGAALGSPDTVHDFGDVKSSGFKDKTPQNGLYNEAGEKKATEYGDRDTGFNLVFMQRDSALIDNLRNEVRNKYYITLHKMSQSGALASGNTQWLFAFGKFNPDVEFSLPGGEIPATFEGIILESSISLTPGELSSWTGNSTTFTTTITIPAGDWCKFVEVSS